MGEEGKGLPWFHQMGLLKCLEPMHTLTVQAYFPTCVSAFMECNRANGGGKIFEAICKNL
jgi:hypothetical protein